MVDLNGSSDKEQASWSQGAKELHREIARDLLTHTCSAVFEDGLEGRGPPARKLRVEKSKGIILAGHGGGALVAYQTALSLLQHYPDELQKQLKCITFGMPVMGWHSREQRDAMLRMIAPTLSSIPLLRRDLPCPHFLHIVRQEDAVPASSLCSRKVRASVAAALALAAQRGTAGSLAPACSSDRPCLGPYRHAFSSDLLRLRERDADPASGANSSEGCGRLDAEEGGARWDAAGALAPPSPHAQDAYEQQALESMYGVQVGDEGGVRVGRAGDGDSVCAEEESASPTQPWRWKAWGKSQHVGMSLTGDAPLVDWALLLKMLRQEVDDAALPDWWPLGKFWFLQDSQPFDAAGATHTHTHTHTYTHTHTH